MDHSEAEKISKFLSYVLRHQPEHIGLSLDQEGWAHIDDLIAGANSQGYQLTHEIIRQVVADNDKQRFSLSADLQKIRAAQGHSTSQVNLNYTAQTPPEILYHGTAQRFLSSILQQGLLAGARHHVHLSTTMDTAVKVGQRYGKPIVLQVAAHKMHADGHAFFLADNGVWLTQAVPPVYLSAVTAK